MEILALLVAIVALFMAWAGRNRLRDLNMRLALLEDGVERLRRRLELGDLTQLVAAPPPLPAPPPSSAPSPQEAGEGEPTEKVLEAAAALSEAAAEPPRRAAVPPVPPAPPPPPEEPERSFEERFGTQWTVWVGGIALALGGVFLVRYSIEQGLVGPGVRTFMGALLAVVLVAAGEWTRRNELNTGLYNIPTAHIPSILTAAGTMVAFATIYAAHALYGFLGPGAAFILLGLVALATLTAALLHGPALAGLGLVGAYVTPLLVSSTTPSFWALYLYLIVVTGAAFALARMRMWRWLAITAVVASALWALPGLQDAAVHSTAPHVFYVAVSLALAATLIVAGLLYGPDAEPDVIDPISSCALIAYLLPAALLVMASRHDTLALVAFAVFVAACVAIAWRAPSSTAVVPAAAVLAVLVLLEWAVNIPFEHLVAPSGPTAGVVPEPIKGHVGLHLLLGGVFAALFGGVGFLAQGRSGRSEIPQIWAGCAVAIPLLILGALYYRIYGFERSIPFAGLALLLAALYAVGTDLLSRREPRPGLEVAAALFAVGSVASLALALTLALQRGWLTIALALMVPGIAWVAERRPLPMLRWLAAIVGVCVLARIGWEPRIVGSQVGTTPIFNWLLYGYGVPALAFWVGGWLLRKHADDVPSRMIDSLALLFTVLLAFLEIRHYINAGDVYRPSAGLTEVALQVAVGLAMTIGLERVRLGTQNVVHDVGAIIIATLTLITIVLGLVIVQNPVITGQPVGGPVFNLILLGYGLPAVLTIALALVARATRPMPYRVIAAVTAVALSILYLSLEVRWFYHGSVLTGPTGDAEQYTYSAVWLVYGVVLLLAGIALRSQPARLASAAVIILTVAKVFLYDMAGLTGIFRALSFIGLGLVLVGIGYLYQRLLFPPRPPAAAVAAAAPPA